MAQRTPLSLLSAPQLPAATGGLICPQCQMEFDGRQCWECLNRSEAVSETVALFLPVFGAGLLAEIVAYGFYPPLISNSWAIWNFPILVAVIAVAAFVLAMSDRMDRYATPFRVLFALGSSLPLLITAFYFLNGFLEEDAGVKIPPL